ncbi:MAG TPA: hypothetical protein VLK33_17915 [Terriglobales bacterium]|nr:hypothetical protein [Terriglobales bacterium]
MHKRAGSAAGTEEIDEQIKDLRVQNRRRFEVLTRSSGAGENKNS